MSSWEYFFNFYGARNCIQQFLTCLLTHMYAVLLNGSCEDEERLQQCSYTKGTKEHQKCNFKSTFSHELYRRRRRLSSHWFPTHIRMHVKILWTLFLRCILHILCYSFFPFQTQTDFYTSLHSHSFESHKTEHIQWWCREKEETTDA